jgi:hypothetical protein
MPGETALEMPGEAAFSVPAYGIVRCPVVAAARRPSASLVLAALRALCVDRLLAGGKARHLPDDARLHPGRLVTWWSCGLREPGAVGPCGGFVVVAAVLEASVQDAGETAGEAAQRVVVVDVPGAELVVEGAGAGGGGERG